VEAETLLVEYFIDRYVQKAATNIRGANKKTLRFFRATGS